MPPGSFTLRIDAARSVSAALHPPAGAPSGAGVVLGHGAGSDMESPALVAAAEALAAFGHAALRFNFLYRELRKKLPDRQPDLERCYRAAADRARAETGVARLILGGRSMGGRMASLLAAGGYPCAGLVFFGYPLHPAGREEKLRDAHLAAVTAPMLFVQGTRDALCNLDLLRPVLARLGDRATLHVLEGGDHSLELPRRSGRSRADAEGEVFGAVDDWIRSRVLRSRG